MDMLREITWIYNHCFHSYGTKMAHVTYVCIASRVCSSLINISLIKCVWIFNETIWIKYHDRMDHPKQRKIENTDNTI